MQWAHAIFANGGDMIGGAVSLVFGKPIFRMFALVCDHDTIAGHFRDDRGRGNRQTPGITLYDGRVWQAERRDRPPIHQGMHGHGVNLTKRFVHSAKSSLKNVDLVNYRLIVNTNTKLNGLSVNAFKKFFAGFFSKFFGIIYFVSC